jgi:hypothetical protein
MYQKLTIKFVRYTVGVLLTSTQFAEIIATYIGSQLQYDGNRPLKTLC